MVYKIYRAHLGLRSLLRIWGEIHNARSCRAEVMGHRGDVESFPRRFPPRLPPGALRAPLAQVLGWGADASDLRFVDRWKTPLYATHSLVVAATRSPPQASLPHVIHLGAHNPPHIMRT